MSDARWKALFDAEPDAVMILASDGTVREMNPAGLAIFEAERPEDMIGIAVHTFAASAHKEVCRAFIDRACQGHKGFLELEMFGRKGTPRMLVWYVVPLPNEPSGPAVLALAKNVTALREKEAGLRESRKLAAVGELAGGFAHDFSNLLNGIMGSLWMAATKLGADNPAAPMLAAAGQTGRRAADLTRRLLSIGRRAREEPRPVALQDVAKDVVDHLRQTVSHDIEISLVADPDLWTIQAPHGQVREALVHLCANACEAMPKGGRLTVELRKVTDKAGADKPGDRIRLIVGDTGEGIDADSLPHIFEPFFTKKADGEHLGLGLTVVQTIVNRLGGTIEMDSQPGRGSRFTVEIPRRVEEETAAAPAATAPPAAATTVQGKGEVILVVDDEEILRVVARAALEQVGYAVLEAENGTDAMEVFQRERQRIAAVVTDLKMPGRSGLELLADLRKLDPNVRVVLCSGSLAEGSKINIAQAGAKAFLPKPYSAVELTRTVHQILVPR